ncbi:MAG: hypothetical protein HY270_00095 [Deltaproteobacteria bacterium]|nr:hypothetical protein [Deltaproteobacteria bacterium]
MRSAALLLTLLVASCAAPARQYDIRGRPLSCEQANAAAVRTLQVLHFTLTAVEPAVVGARGSVRGSRNEDGAEQTVRVDVTCNGQNTDLVVTEESRLISSIELKRAFFLAFDAVLSAQEQERVEAKAEAARPLAQKRNKGLHVRLHPIPGPGSRLDLGVDVSQASILPVRISIVNSTARSFRFEASDIVLLRQDGKRVQAIGPEAAAASVVAPNHSAVNDGQAAVSPDSVRSALVGHALRAGTVAADQTLEGFLYFPAGEYVKGRAAFEDVESEETEGFFVEF